jgi:hypothetical protein
VTGLLLAYVSVCVHQRHSRLFPGFLPAFALVAGLGVVRLPRAAGGIVAVLLTAASLLLAYASAFDDRVLNGSLFARHVLVVAAGESGPPAIDSYRELPVLERHSREYDELRIPEVV